jgi:hypothetical protein
MRPQRQLPPPACTLDYHLPSALLRPVSRSMWAGKLMHGLAACETDGGCLFWRADLLAEVRKREKALGVEPDWAVDAMMRASAVEGAPSRCPQF